MFPFEYAQLLMQSKVLEAKIVTGTEESTGTDEESLRKQNHSLGFIAEGATTLSVSTY
jgi:hypothetical protein